LGATWLRRRRVAVTEAAHQPALGVIPELTRVAVAVQETPPRPALRRLLGGGGGIGELLGEL